MTNFIILNSALLMVTMSGQRKKQAMREAILADAREDYERKKKRKELTPSYVTTKGREIIGKKRKKKSKKEGNRKHKSKKFKAPTKEDTNSSSSESGDEIWVEQSSHDKTSEAEKLKRDEWMNMPLELQDRMVSTEKPAQKSDVACKMELLDKPGQHPLELNPYWKGGGSGLPHDMLQQSSPVQSSTSFRGDGGRSWILRSYKRALQQAESEGKSIDEIAAHRWGSIDKLHSLLQSAGIDPHDPDGPCATGQKEYLYSAMKHPVQENKNMEGTKVKKGVSEKLIGGGFIKPSSSSNHSTALPKKQSKATDDALQSRNWKITNSVPNETDKCVPIDSTIDTNLHLKTQASPKLDSSVLPVTDTHLNAVAAKLMKAELVGDERKIRNLKEELEQLRRLKDTQGPPSNAPTHQDTTVVVATTDRFGRTRPAEVPSTSRAPPIRADTHNRKGKRKKYFENDDRYTLKSMIEEERKLTAEDTHQAIERMASKFVRASNTDETVDDVLDTQSAMRYDQGKEKAQYQRIMRESRKMTEVLSRCKFCFGNTSFEKQFLVAAGIAVYLSVPSYRPLTEKHCLLIPMEHTPCSLQMDENVWSEVKVFQKGLTHMFGEHGMDVIFTESYMHPKSQSHMFIDCIPIPKEEGYLAPMYFKKAILESDTEWSENRKLIDTKKKGLRSSIPVGLPYFFVDFGVDNGYAHIIEDQTKFPHYFAKEVVGGLLDVEPQLWLKPPKARLEDGAERVKKFLEWWTPYDWTKKLHEPH